MFMRQAPKVSYKIKVLNFHFMYTVALVSFSVHVLSRAQEDVGLKQTPVQYLTLRTSWPCQSQLCRGMEVTL